MFEMFVELNGLTLMATLDPTAGASQFDGFATSSGATTQILEADKLLIASLRTHLDELGTEVSGPVNYLRRMVGLWEEWPESMGLQHQVLGEQDRGYTSICWALNSYTSATHDCWSGGGDRWDDGTTLDYAYVSMHAAGPCSDGTYFWNGAWTCYEPDHQNNIEYGYGNCLGRCGGGCGGGTAFTWDCLDHDQCVRTGHDTASLWCDDDFVATWDDAALAPNCY